jgi:hypothetical protein
LKYQLSPAGLRPLNYSSSDYDGRHSLTAHYVYTSPASYWHNSILKKALGGWTAAGTVFFHTGYPFSIVDSGLIKSFGNLTGKIQQAILADFLGGASYPACNTPNTTCYSTSEFAAKAAQRDLGNVPRNSFRGPGYFNTDLNLSKTFATAERYKVIVGASFFNVLNHPNFAPPVNNIGSGAFGFIQSTVTEPTSAYGDDAGSAVSGRVIQTMIRFSF